MNQALLLTIIVAYFALLLVVSYLTSRKANNDSFFVGNRNSNWVLVAFGMIGTSLSGVTFVSVPGAVGKDGFHYLQVTIGYLIGYIVIAYVLLPLYYRLNLTSIYTYLQSRLGIKSYKTGASFFILSRLVGATGRLYLVINILQLAILDSFNVPFWVTTLILLGMIILYTYEGGVKTIVWTDTLQTTCMLAGLIICTIYILNNMDLSVSSSLSQMSDAGYLSIFETDPNSKNFFIKQILAGAFITITMTGVDQEMMQKSISVPNLKDSQKNMISLSVIMLITIGIFLYMGGLLHLFADATAVNASGDALFPAIALNHMPPAIGIIFTIALISALFPSADGAMTALTSSICIDILNLKSRSDWDDAKQKKVRQMVHLSVAFSFLIMVLFFKQLNDPSMIGIILKLAGYTYGPLLGLFAFGILTKRTVQDNVVPFICIISPIITYLIDKYQSNLFGSFQIGLELIIVNGLITFVLLWCFPNKKQSFVDIN